MTETSQKIRVGDIVRVTQTGRDRYSITTPGSVGMVKEWSEEHKHCEVEFFYYGAGSMWRSEEGWLEVFDVRPSDLAIARPEDLTPDAREAAVRYRLEKAL